MYKPLKQCLRIADSSIEGQGVFATEDIPIGTNLGETHIEDSRFEDGYVRTPLGGFYNHSDDPNCKREEVEGGIFILVAVKAIVVGDEITVHYTMYEV